MKIKFLDLCKESMHEIVEELNGFFGKLHTIYNKKYYKENKK